MGSCPSAAEALLQRQDSDREVANAAARALAGVVVAAHGAANLEDSFGDRGFFGRNTARTCVYMRESERESCGKVFDKKQEFRIPGKVLRQLHTLPNRNAALYFLGKI